MSNSIIKNTGRVMYVEPNDVYGSINGVPLTPNYEDYCIGFNLVVEGISRYKPNLITANNSGSGNSDNYFYVMSWTSKDGSQSDNWISFMKGEGDSNTFLTTYYTDITFDKVRNNSIVEGLGVESVTVSFESYYTPTVVIKFVDVRGSALFAREDAIHVDGKLTAENIFGCFMMLPYPKFKLQIKGFYGKPVTYQLTVSNFQGAFNAKTGNFEITVKFIGYSYSLLTDIPLMYLVAAPYCNYEGRSYWNGKKNSSQWALSNGKEPPTLYELINRIDSSISEIDDEYKMSDEDSEASRNYENENNALNNIQTLLNDLVNELVKNGISYILTENNEDNTVDDKPIKQLLVMYNKIDDEENCRKNITDVERKKQSELVDALNEYNAAYPNNKIDRGDFFDSRQTAWTSAYHSIKDLINIDTDSNDKITKITLNGYSNKEIETIKKIKIGGTYPTYTMGRKFRDIISEPYDNKKVGRYCALFYIGKLENTIYKRKETIKAAQEAIVKRIAIDKGKKILKTLDFTPHIGNIFKIIMCHLETLCHIVSSSVNDAASGDRTPSHLGVDINATDALNIDTIPPWPGIYNKGIKTENGGYISPENNIRAWPADFSHNFIEEDVIRGLRSAVMRIEKSETSDKAPTSVMTAFPILPCDLNSSNSPFYNSNDKDLGSLAGYLGIRMAQLFGIMFNDDISSSLIKITARMDAYNFCMAIDGKDALKNDIMNVVNNGKIADALTGIMLCDADANIHAEYHAETQKYSHPFENHAKLKDEYNDKERCPILMQDGDIYYFVRYYNANEVSMVPARIDDWDEYKESIFSYYPNSGDAYFSPTFETSSNLSYCAKEFLHICNTSQVVDDEDNWENYINEDLFNILTTDSEVKGIEAKYNNLNTGKIVLPDYEGNDDFTAFLNKVWLIGESKYCEYYKNSPYVLTQNAETLGLDNDSLLGDDRTTQPSTLKYNEWLSKGMKNIVKYASNGELVISSSLTSDDGLTSNSANTVNSEELVVQQSHIMQENGIYSLFGHVFYYMQNEKLSGETESEWLERRTKSKCLLFLYTLNFNLSKIPNFLKANKDCGTIEEVPYGYILLLGGMLWRYRYYKNNNMTDPIITKVGNIRFKNDIHKALSVKYSDGSYRLRVFKTSDTSNYNVSLTDIFGGDSADELEIDYYVENKLIRLFETFALGSDFGTIISNCEINNIDSSTSTVKIFFAQTFNQFIKDYISSVYGFNSSISDALYLLENRTTGIFKKYSAIYVERGNNLGAKLLLREDNKAQEIIKLLYYKKSVVLDTGWRKLDKNNDESIVQVSISSSCFDAYINEFVSTLKAIADGGTATDITPMTEDDDEKENNDRDGCIAMYYYIKNLYDKWLLMANEDEFNVENFFKDNFVFIDKFYVNVYNLVMINCEIFSELYHSRIRGRDTSLFSFIGDIVGKHHCMFVALPDFIDFGETEQDRINAMEKLFKPLSFNEGMTKMRNHNNFVIIFTGPNAERASDMNNYICDSFNIGSNDSVISNIFSSTPSDYSDGNDIYTKYGYNVPSFGVSFGRQNQHIFKDIAVNMNNPMDTDVSISTAYAIALKGSQNTGGLMYYGQDIYNIYSSYSYECDIEMMGNAQIQPLMYFQLLNIPMWNGAYMIFNVVHTMTPGNMTTKIKGQKMSKYNVPYPSNYVTKTKETPSIDSVSSKGNSSDAISKEIDYEMPSSYENAGSDISCDLDNLENNYISNEDKPKFTLNGVQLNDELCTLISQLIEEIRLLPENKEKETWTILLSSAVRNGGGTSEHDYNHTKVPANAVDIQIATVGSNGSKTKIKDAEKVFKVMDILATNHLSEIGQLIFEGASGYGFVDGTGSYLGQSSSGKYTCLHLSHRGNRSNAMIFMSDNSSGTNLAKNYTVSYLDSNVPAGYKAIAKKHYTASSSDAKFKNIFIYYQSFTSSELEEHFGTERKETPVASSISC